MNKVEAFINLPYSYLPPCSATDFLHFIFLDKPAVRLYIDQEGGLSRITSWCDRYEFQVQADNEGYICVAREQSLATLVLAVDQSNAPHEYSLGRLLGYPSCCCKFIAEVGEEKIDDIEKEVLRWQFSEEFRLINPLGYTSGDALICHVPCLSKCELSLKIAKDTLKIVKYYSGIPLFNRWSYWLRS